MDSVGKPSHNYIHGPNRDKTGENYSGLDQRCSLFLGPYSGKTGGGCSDLGRFRSTVSDSVGPLRSPTKPMNPT